MEKITKNVICEVVIQINQEVDFSKAELAKLEKYLDKESDVSMYMRINDGLDGLIGNPIYDLLQSKIDFDEAQDIEFTNVELEDVE